MAIDAPDQGLAWRGAPAHLAVDSPFCIASCTKLLVTALIFQLIDKGAFALDTSAKSLLPTGQMEGLHTLGNRDYSSAITVRHLLSNTSGLPDYFEDKPKGASSFLEDILAGGDVGWTGAQALERARQLTPRFEPGTPGKAHYSDTNFLLLGQILENVTGESFAALVAERIVRPLGLTQTWMLAPQTADRVGEVVPISNGQTPLAIPKTMLSLGAEGGLVSTLDESMRLLKAFMSAELFDNHWLDRMKKNTNPVFYPFHYGLGVMKFELHPVMTGFRRQAPLYGHSGSSGVLMYHCPQRNFWICGTTNQLGAQGLPYQFMLRAISVLK